MELIIKYKKYKFSTDEKFAIWQTFQYKCFWCKEPIKFKLVQIDHILPEYLLYKDNEYEKIKIYFSLPNDFKINDFTNWVPACSKCNSEKGKEIYDNPAMIKALNDVIKKSKVSRYAYEQLKKDRDTEKVLVKLVGKLETDEIDPNDLKILASSTCYSENFKKIIDSK